MRLLILYGIMFFLFFNCKAQEKMTLRYVDHQYKETKNKSFVNNELVFIKSEDTLRMNVKVPFKQSNAQIINRGIFYNCHLKENTIYTITLKKICINDIPEAFNSYYRTNTITDKTDCSKFTEIKNNTNYEYKGDYEKYVDIDNVLYEIIELSPNTGCFYPH
ncbi:hypothetical protein SAMN05443634_102300 [Chishuiella changwenlii]|uniref:Uncharacterized protein n=1 Tax=Chishuiella changwenlii TaxID=1434701 RepID=A0A1M6UBU3_9FLAO|nr:hypothetical protein [Chishuiella changwenlii]GGE99254.1 hypothetical protein GCM10010984_16040 [Chishuiella changwenlii]SHK66633.1 hypothetical protein SAMN05443634_102300 [Chishuiella changwenlii]